MLSFSWVLELRALTWIYVQQKGGISIVYRVRETHGIGERQRTSTIGAVTASCSAGPKNRLWKVGEGVVAF